MFQPRIADTTFKGAWGGIRVSSCYHALDETPFSLVPLKDLQRRCESKQGPVHGGGAGPDVDPGWEILRGPQPHGGLLRQPLGHTACAPQ